MIDAGTLQGYSATTYSVTLPDEDVIGLRLEASSPQADAFLHRMNANSITCLNAWNPRSRRMPVTRNMAAHQRLRRELASRRLIALPHLGVPDRHGWRPEPGFAVLDLETEKAITLAERYGQFAIVHYRRSGVAELILTRLAMR